MDEQKKGTRRRGEILEEAIMDATLDELDQIGYAHLTMEKVADRAGTNKAVLYRRWANKYELVIAALHKRLPKITEAVPNTGNLRDDVYAYLQERIRPLKAIGVQTIRGLMMEPLIWRHIAAAMPQFAQWKSENKLTAAMTAMMKNAEKRGEVCLEGLSPRIITLPIDLLQYELITKQEISDTTVTEIVDEIFMPLIRYSQTADQS
ncbi:putative HTH-type transcriptional regulator [Caprobacter fermentans]|uniref:Putative HTH-type transcriptional regulator n=1 Tax=Caproicibacter fermentans TaxID=2576756 RepID=A0A6N8HXU9_9FIRM|nr:TetR/AcrR family transcriptional regulator [Caproicibacter fermentans]MVB10519.1 putative HTH-type transcriptional regulator [Caproicibacter fermentans]OCN01006.1 transcriptional regulator [Clostridium sp. W14A]QNK40128.1 TetR/AcrR family transcriptional regulator [Caproicibacter fermentans]